MPNPDLASKASPLLRAPEIVTSVKIVSVIGFSGCPLEYLVWNMIPWYVGSTMSTSLTRMARKSLDAENNHIPGKVCAPQKWPPQRMIEMFSNLVGVVPKPRKG